MTAMIQRNIRLFFRDKASVFFSLLGVLIILGLYVLFLSDVTQSSMPGLPGARFFMDSWIMSGMLAVTGMTSTMGALGVMVEDRSKKILKDFSASPLSRRSLVGGYVISAYVVGVFMTVVALLFSEGYIVAGGGTLLPLGDLLLVLACILLSVMASSAMVFFLVSLFKSMNAFATASTVVGTLAGFLTGIYIPIGNLPPAVQTLIKIFPVSHAGVLLRRIMMRAPMAASFADMPVQEAAAIETMLGVRFLVGGTPMSTGAHIAVLMGTTVVFYGLAVWNLSRKQK